MKKIRDWIKLKFNRKKLIKFIFAKTLKVPEEISREIREQLNLFSMEYPGLQTAHLVINIDECFKPLVCLSTARIIKLDDQKLLDQLKLLKNIDSELILIEREIYYQIIINRSQTFHYHLNQMKNEFWGRLVFSTHIAKANQNVNDLISFHQRYMDNFKNLIEQITFAD